MKLRISGRDIFGRAIGIAASTNLIFLGATVCYSSTTKQERIPNVFEAVSTASDAIFHLSVLVLAVTDFEFRTRVLNAHACDPEISTTILRPG
jgi:hypothetical protein